MKVTQVQLCKIELLTCRDWDEYQWVLMVARLMRQYNFGGVMV